MPGEGLVEAAVRYYWSQKTGFSDRSIAHFSRAATGPSAAVASTSSEFRGFFERFLESVVLLLMTTLAVVVVLGVVFRKAGGALVWYDEVASILLAWLTYYASSLAALKRSHIGFPKLVEAAGLRLRLGLVVFREFVVVGFFVLVAWTGWRIVQVLEGTYLVSLPWMPAQVAQSVIPIGAVLFVIAELVSAVDVLGKSRSVEDRPIEETADGNKPSGDQQR